MWCRSCKVHGAGGGLRGYLGVHQTASKTLAAPQGRKQHASRGRCEKTPRVLTVPLLHFEPPPSMVPRRGWSRHVTSRHATSRHVTSRNVLPLRPELAPVRKLKHSGRRHRPDRQPHPGVPSPRPEIRPSHAIQRRRKRRGSSPLARATATQPPKGPIDASHATEAERLSERQKKPPSLGHPPRTVSIRSSTM